LVAFGAVVLGAVVFAGAAFEVEALGGAAAFAAGAPFEERSLRRRAATGSSTVEAWLFTVSPIFSRCASTSLEVRPSSLAIS
jgi:hypothetical protein